MVWVLWLRLLLSLLEGWSDQKAYDDGDVGFGSIDHQSVPLQSSRLVKPFMKGWRGAERWWRPYWNGTPSSGAPSCTAKLSAACCSRCGRPTSG